MHLLNALRNTHFTLRPMETPFPEPERLLPGIDGIDPESFPGFLDEIGHVGMGGAGFRTSEKIRAAKGAHTLVINGVECEPGLTIDQATLIHGSLWVAAGAHACATAIGAKRIVLAAKQDERFIAELKKRYGEFEIITFPDRYPAGAEKLILRKLTGSMPPPGVRPHQMGYLVQNVVSLRAIGRAIIDGVPVVERPMTLAKPATGFHVNTIVPVGISVREVLETFKLPFDPSLHLLVASGLMMGKEVGLDYVVEKTTFSLFVIHRDSVWREERACIRCGACNNACPLGLHPYALVGKIKKGKTSTKAFESQLTECFLCGVCSAVCPSDIPLVQTLKEGRQCL